MRFLSWFDKGDNLQDKKYKAKVVLPLVVVAIFMIFPYLFESPYYLNLVSFILCYALLAMSLDLLVGYSGLSSLGHAAFFGSAAYCAGILNVRFDWSFLASFFAGLVFTILLAALFGLLTTRVSGVIFLMVNLALGQVMWGLAHRWASVTGGDNALVGISRPEVFGFIFNTPERLYYLIFGTVAVCAYILYRLINSSFGLTMRGVKHSPKRMRALGYNVYQHRYITYIISGTFAGIAGMLFAFFNLFVSPTEVHVITSAKAMLMVLMGGAGSLFGPAIGAFIVVGLEQFISAFMERWVLVLGILYVLTVMYFPGGLIQLYGMFVSLLKKIPFNKKKSVMAERE